MTRPNPATKSKLCVANIVFNDFRHDTRVEKICRSLVLAGYEVTVFALGGAGLPVREERSGWTVVRAGEWGKVRSLLWLACRFLTSVRQFDFVHCNDLEPLPLCVIAKGLKFGKTKLVYDAHELETEKLAARGFRQSLSRFLEGILIPFADGVITVGDRIADWYGKKYGLKRPSVVENAPPKWNPKIRSDLLRRQFDLSSGMRIFLYLGGLQEGRAIEPMLDAFSGVEDAALVLMGYGGTSLKGKKLEALVRDRTECEPNLFFHEPVGQEELAKYVASADVGLCLIEDKCLSYRYCLPNKLFEYAMAGLPIIVSDLPEMRDKVEAYRCGVVCGDLSSSGIRVSIEEIIAMESETLKNNARYMAEEHCWEKQEKKLIELYESLLKVA